jgi:hypothetical protein
METWQILAFTVLGIIIFVAIGAMNSTFKNTTSEVPQVGNQMLFIISCMIAGMLIYFNHGLIYFILLCFFIFIFFI